MNIESKKNYTVADLRQDAQEGESWAQMKDLLVACQQRVFSGWSEDASGHGSTGYKHGRSVWRPEISQQYDRLRGKDRRLSNYPMAEEIHILEYT